MDIGVKNSAEPSGISRQKGFDEMIDFSDNGTIHTVDDYTDENGEEFIVFNGSAYYPKKQFTVGEAKRDFQNPKSIMERADAEYRIWCD